MGVMTRYVICPHIGWFDEAEMAISTTHWRWFYHPNNPPLYHWLLLGVYQIFGVHPLSHLILKNLLMGLTIYSLYQAGVKTFGDKLLGVCLGLSPLFIKDWGIWGAFKFTHSILLACIMAMTFWQIVRFIQRPNGINALFLGGVMALGCLSKYNFIFFMLACLGALLAEKQIRTNFLSLLGIWIILPTLVVLSIHILAVLDVHHHHDLTAVVAHKFKEGAHSSVLMTFLDQIRLVITQVFEQTFPLNMALIAILFTTRDQWALPKTIIGRFFTFQQFFALISLMGMVLGLGITDQPKRYILPFIMGLPFMVFACIPHLMLWRHMIVLLFTGLVVVREIWVFALMVVFCQEASRGEESVMLPYGDYQSLARVIEKEGHEILVTDDLIAAGNLKFYLPHMTIYKIGYNDFWLNSSDEKAYNQRQIVYLCAKTQCSGKINLPMAMKRVSLPLKAGQKDYELMTLKIDK